ncbi:MAG: hypothetical protein ACO37F_06230, partial [Pirellulales bacterium]
RIPSARASGFPEFRSAQRIIKSRRPGDTQRYPRAGGRGFTVLQCLKNNTESVPNTIGTIPELSVN